MRESVSTQRRLSDYCEQDVLPALFDRLDDAFPEFQWNRMSTGWVGTIQGNSRRAAETVYCRQPWGFVSAQGEAQSWMAYVNNGNEPQEDQLVPSIRQLAQLAGVDDGMFDGVFSIEEKRAVKQSKRQRQLLEAFVAYCQASLSTEAGRDAIDYLESRYGFDGRQIGDVPLGIYTSRKDVMDFLVGVGFDRGEVLASRAMCDRRLPGRIITAWRDRWGQIQKIVAHSMQEDVSAPTRNLYCKRTEIKTPFGLDIALRATGNGCENLVLVEEELNALSLQARGEACVATFGSAGRIPTEKQWEALADLGVKSVTLAFSDDRAGERRTLAAIHSAQNAHRAPEVFALPRLALGNSQHAAAYASRQGIEPWRALLERRIHAYHFVANAIVRKHKGKEWTDAGLMNALTEAMKFDMQVYRPQRAWQLDRFFWAFVLQATGARWPAVKKQLPQRMEDLKADRLGTWRIDPCETLLDQLKSCLDREDLDRFSSLIWMAARDLTDLEKPPLKKKKQVTTTSKAMFKPEQITIEKRSPQEDTLPEVAVIAYQLWQDRGCPEGLDKQFWIEAEQNLKQLSAQWAEE